MKKLLKRTSFLVCAVAMMLNLAACSSGTTAQSAAASTSAVAADTTEIVLWHPMGGQNGKTLEAIAQSFNNTVGKEKSIHVTTVYQGKNADLSKKLRAAFQANDFKNMPDLTFAPASDTGYMKDLDVIVKAQDVFDSKSIGLSAQDFEQAAIKSMTIKNVVVGLPYAPSTILFYYNKDAFSAAGLDPQAAPATLKELGEYSEKLTKREGDNVVQYGFGYKINSWPLSSWIGQQDTAGAGYSLFGDQNNGHDAAMTKVQFDTDNTMKTFLDAYAKAAKQGTFKYLEDDSKNNFASGNITMTLDSSAGINAIQELAAGKFEVGVANLPKVDDTANGGVSCGGSALYPINKRDDAKLNAVYEYLKYLYSPEMQLQWHSGTGYLAAVTATYETDAYKEFVSKNPAYAVAVSQLHASNPNISEPMCGVGGAISDSVQNGIISVLDGTNDIGAAVSTTAQECNQALDDYNAANPGN